MKLITLMSTLFALSMVFIGCNSGISKDIYATAQKQVTDTSQKVGELQTSFDQAKSELDSTRQSLSKTQQQLADAQNFAQKVQGDLNATKQVVEDTQKKLDASTKLAADLKAKLDLITLPTPIAHDPVKVSAGLGQFALASIPITVSAFDEVRGEIICANPPCDAYIQDPAGKNIQDFGRVTQSNFSFTAPADGRYSFVIRNPFSSGSSYSLTYTVYTPYKRQ